MGAHVHYENIYNWTLHTRKVKQDKMREKVLAWIKWGTLTIFFVLQGTLALSQTVDKLDDLVKKKKNKFVTCMCVRINIPMCAWNVHVLATSAILSYANLNANLREKE